MEGGSEHQPRKKEGHLVPDPPPLPKKEREVRVDTDPHPTPNKKVRVLPNPQVIPRKDILEKSFDELTDEELWLMCDESNLGRVELDKAEMLKLRKFNKQMEESEGFDCDETPSIGVPPGGIHKARCDEKKWPDLYEEYMTIAKFAIEDYNQKNNTEFVVSKVESVNMIYAYCQTYFMTFTAENVAKDGGSNPASAADSSSKVFQTKVHARLHGIQHLQFKMLEFCRLKKAQSEK